MFITILADKGHLKKTFWVGGNIVHCVRGREAEEQEASMGSRTHGIWSQEAGRQGCRGHLASAPTPELRILMPTLWVGFLSQLNFPRNSLKDRPLGISLR